MSLKSKGKSVADAGAYEHLVALPNRFDSRLPQTGGPGVSRGPMPAPGAADVYCFAFLVFQRATSMPARCAPPDWTMTEARAGFKFCCRNDSSAKKTRSLHHGVTETRRKAKNNGIISDRGCRRNSHARILLACVLRGTVGRVIGLRLRTSYV